MEYDSAEQSANKSKSLTVQFNPETYSLDKNINPVEIQTQKNITQFIKNGSSSLNMQLLFDTYDHTQTEQKDVRDLYAFLRNCLQINPDTHTVREVQFTWGSFIFIGTIIKLKENYTMFSPGGIPVRAKVDVKINGFTQEEQNAQPNCSPDRTKIHTISQGDTLWEISYKEYGDIAMWKTIAIANNLENPRILTSGNTLIIPAVTGGAL